jgi:hypothetical protein
MALPSLPRKFRSSRPGAPGTLARGSVDPQLVQRVAETQRRMEHARAQPALRVPPERKRQHAHRQARQAEMTGPGDPYSGSPPGRGARVRLRLAGCRRHRLNWRALVAIIALSSLLAPGVAAVIAAVL